MMTSYPALVFVVTSTLIAYCSGKNITAYIKEILTTTRCESVARVPSVCNVDWKVPLSAVNDYEENIKTVNETISSPSIVFGLSPSEAIKCRKAYEDMICRSYFPVCDPKRMVIDYGNGTERCESVQKVCRTIAMEGCEYSAKGEQTIVLKEKKCVPLLTNTSKFCPNFKMKVPSGFVTFAGKYIEHLSETAGKFKQQTKNLTGMESCQKNFQEVICRVIDACSPDGYYSLHLISKEECEDKMSCIINSDGLLTMHASICTILPNAASLKKYVLKDPQFQEDSTDSPNVHDENPSRILGPTLMSFEEQEKNQPTKVQNTSSRSFPLVYRNHSLFSTEATDSPNVHDVNPWSLGPMLMSFEEQEKNETNKNTSSGSFLLVYRSHPLFSFTFVLSTVPTFLLHVA